MSPPETKTWVLTRQAETALIAIADWTHQTFGPPQAALYGEEPIARISALAAAELPSRSCKSLIDPALPEDLRYCRAGQHFVVFIEEATRLIVVDLLHVSSDLPRRLAALALPGDSHCPSPSVTGNAPRSAPSAPRHPRGPHRVP